MRPRMSDPMPWQLIVTQVFPPRLGSDIQTWHDDHYPTPFETVEEAAKVGAARLLGDPVAVRYWCRNLVTGRIDRDVVADHEAGG